MSKILLISLSCVFAASTLAHAQADRLPQREDLAKIDTNFKYKGSQSCLNCHVVPGGGYVLAGVEKFVALNEVKTWLNEDPHSRAWLRIIPDRKHFDAITRRLTRLNEVVNREACRDSGELPDPVVIPNWEKSSNKLSLEILLKTTDSTEVKIAELFTGMTDHRDLMMRRDKLNEFSPRLVSTVKQCMSCHAGWDQRQDTFDTEVIHYGTGVSCEGCHGPASQWFGPHANEDWRSRKPQEEKADKFGMYNVRQPIAKSQLCFSCHIGDVDQGKVVTHAMYAAGHPPLPSIEMESFADQLPRHWRYLSEKKAFKLGSEFKQRFADSLKLGSVSELERDYSRTKNLLVGGVMAAASSIDLLAESAGEYIDLKKSSNNSNSGIERDKWPEFAAFDCASCHHDLKTSGWERGFAGVPGRPPAPYWPRTLSKLGVAWLSVQKQDGLFDKFSANQQSLQDALDRQPFGKPEQLLLAGKQYSQYLQEDVAKQIQGTPLTRDDAITALQMLCGNLEGAAYDPQDEIWDFHAARQLAWAINLVYSEIAQPRIPGQARLSDQFKAPNKEFARVFGEIREYLILDLSATGEITEQQQRYLTAWRDFDRKQFVGMINQLSAALKNTDFTDYSTAHGELSLDPSN